MPVIDLSPWLPPPTKTRCNKFRDIRYNAVILMQCPKCKVLRRVAFWDDDEDLLAVFSGWEPPGRDVGHNLTQESKFWDRSANFRLADLRPQI